MPSPDVLDFAPDRLVDPLPRPTFGERVRTAAGFGFVSLALNVGVVVWLAGIGWPLRPAEATAPISVEIIDHMPGGGGQAGGGAPRTSPGQNEAAKQARAEMPAAAPAKTPDRPTPSAQHGEPVPHQEPKKPESPLDTQAERPTEPTTIPEAHVEPKPPPAPEPAANDPAPSTEPPQEVVQPKPAVPPPPEHPNDTARPQLVEAPKAPAPVATQMTDPLTPPEPAPTAETAPQPTAPAPSQPPVLSSPDAAEVVATPTAPEKPPEPTAEQKRQAEMTAKLAAALPFGLPAGLNPFQSAVGAQGQSASQNYRGAVYANFSKANGLIEEARAKHMRGQAVVAFSIDDKGNLSNLAIAVSSGHADIDATALELIRRSAPFPPPPPGAQRAFSPAIGFGLDE